MLGDFSVWIMSTKGSKENVAEGETPLLSEETPEKEEVETEEKKKAKKEKKVKVPKPQNPKTPKPRLNNFKNKYKNKRHSIITNKKFQHGIRNIN